MVRRVLDEERDAEKEDDRTDARDGVATREPGDDGIAGGRFRIAWRRCRRHGGLLGPHERLRLHRRLGLDRCFGLRRCPGMRRRPEPVAGVGLDRRLRMNPRLGSDDHRRAGLLQRREPALQPREPRLQQRDAVFASAARRGNLPREERERENQARDGAENGARTIPQCGPHDEAGQQSDEPHVLASPGA